MYQKTRVGLEFGSRQVCTVYYGSLYCEHQNLQTNLLEERAPHYKCPSHATFQLLFKTQNKNLCPKLSTSHSTQPKGRLAAIIWCDWRAPYPAYLETMHLMTLAFKDFFGKAL
jgi:hypothetical protein